MKDCFVHPPRNHCNYVMEDVYLKSTCRQMISSFGKSNAMLARILVQPLYTVVNAIRQSSVLGVSTKSAA